MSNNVVWPTPFEESEQSKIKPGTAVYLVDNFPATKHSLKYSTSLTALTTIFAMVFGLGWLPAVLSVMAIILVPLSLAAARALFVEFPNAKRQDKIIGATIFVISAPISASLIYVGAKILGG